MARDWGAEGGEPLETGLPWACPTWLTMARLLCMQEGSVG